MKYTARELETILNAMTPLELAKVRRLLREFEGAKTDMRGGRWLKRFVAKLLPNHCRLWHSHSSMK